MTLLSIEDLEVHFRMRRGWRRSSDDIARAVDGINLAVQPGQTLALVGESGSGKTTVARAVLGLARPTGGRILFEGEDLLTMNRRSRRAAGRDIQIVFQDPYSSLSPRLTIRDAIAEPLRAQRGMSGRELNDRVLALLELVGLGTQHLWRRPHEFSGGQCQRIAIARALALEPKLVVLDEPTSALDVSVQARILALLQQLRESQGLAYLFIAHDLAVVESTADRVAVMYLGVIVEEGAAYAVLREPRHPYTVALLASVPSPDPSERSGLAVLEGDVPSSIKVPSGCRFHPRCRFCFPVCKSEEPVPRTLEDGRRIACHLPKGVPQELGPSAETAATVVDEPLP